MKLIGHRFSFVGTEVEALAMTKMFAALGLEARDIFSKQLTAASTLVDDDFAGAIFAADDNNWLEVWAEIPGLPKGFMLQLIVDDAAAFADHATKNGLDPQGPVDAHGETIYYLASHIGLPISFQSASPKP